MTRKAWLATATVIQALLSMHGGEARANDYLNFGSGPMKNLYVDLIFWGDFTVGDRDVVESNVARVAAYLNGGAESIPGLEPAVHGYGVSGVTPGLWAAVPYGIVPYDSVQLDDGDIQPMVSAAWSGAYGPAYDYGSDNVANWSGLPADTNRLALIVTKGARDYCISSHRLWGCLQSSGYHDSVGGHPYGAVEAEGGVRVLAHEIMEAMTDPYVFNGWATSTNFVGTSHDEAADQCETVPGDFPSLTIDSAFVGPTGSFGQTTCQMLIPEQHAPMDAIFGATGFLNQPPLMLFYTTPSGHINRLLWFSAGTAAWGPTDYGQPASGVTAVGKPSAVYSEYGGGEYVFVKGSDTAVWMRHNDVWTSLGGQIFGDPKATVWTWNNDIWVHVAALGLDDHLYTQGVLNGTPQGWGQIPTGGTRFSGPPTIVSRAVNALDVFAPGEDGSMQWMAYKEGSGWTAPVAIAPSSNDPFLATPSVVTNGGNAAVFAIAQAGVFETSWNGSGWYSMGNAAFQLTSPDYNAGSQGTPAAVSWGTGRYDMFSVSRNGKLFWWYSNSQSAYINTWLDGAPGTTQFTRAPLVSSGVSGDAAAVSRSAGELEVFYRTTNGALTHMTYNSGGGWTTEKAFGSIGPITIYDPPSPNVGATQCNVGGQWMHCCPTGYAMVGADPASNTFKCAPIDNATGPVTLDSSTQRNGMHSCPFGQVMVGLRVDLNLLACQALPANSVTGERVDSGTLDAFPMHTCDVATPTGGMSGINVDGNLLNCASVTQIQ